MRTSWVLRSVGLFAVLVAVMASRSSAGGGAELASQNGDVNGDGTLNIGDVIYTLEHLFSGGPPPVAVAESPDLLARVAALEQIVAQREAVLSHVSIVDLPDGLGGTARTIRISGANLQIVNGLGATAGPPEAPLEAPLNGLGNLIIGYNEERPPAWDDDPNVRIGSHNIVVGPYHNYSSFAGVIFGRRSSISGPFATITGGSHNYASSPFASVAGGNDNHAAGVASTVTGGKFNSANDTFSTVSGGESNTARGLSSSISGGKGRSTVGGFDWVAGELLQEE